MKTKMTKGEIRALKNKHYLEMVMQETGEVFEIDPDRPEQWRSKSTPGLIVDISRQIYYDIKQPGRDDSGDVIGWLRRCYSWTFDQAIVYLRKRTPDPKREDPPKGSRAAKNKEKLHTASEIEPVDHLQKKALQLGGEGIREYFSWNSWEFPLREHIRIEPVIAPQITHCQHCGKRFDWLGVIDQNVDLVPQLFGYSLKQAGPIPMIAYCIKRRLQLDIAHLERGEIQNTFDEIQDALGDVFIEDDDGIVCVDCVSKEVRFYVALSMCERSARSREENEENACVTAGRGEHAEKLSSLPFSEEK
jgi:hypothetical protein